MTEVNKMKKIGLLFAAITMMVLFFAVSANAAYTEIKDGYYTYRIESGEAVVYDVHTWISGDVTIPSTIKSYKVTKIGDSAFKDCTQITSITIPDGVTKIGYEAFEACTSITSITIPDSVTYIDDRAFEFCEKLISVTIPDSVTYIGRSAFIYCYALKSVTLPAGITRIRNSTFQECWHLESITIPDGVTYIGNRAFYHCTYFKSITIPDSVTYIDDEAFRGCSFLSNVYYAGSKGQWNKISIGSENSKLTGATIHFNSCVLNSDKKHSYTSKIITAPTHLTEGVEKFSCKCGYTYTDAIAKIPHSYSVEDLAPTCTAKGYTTYTCECGYTYTIERSAYGHDRVGDTCIDCGEKCSCNCHKNSIISFFYRIILFFQKIFGKNKTCACGDAHY